MAKKKIETIVNELYKKHFDHVQVSMMKIPAIMKELKDIYLADDSEENKNAQYELLVDKYQVKI